MRPAGAKAIAETVSGGLPILKVSPHNTHVSFSAENNRVGLKLLVALML